MPSMGVFTYSCHVGKYASAMDPMGCGPGAVTLRVNSDGWPGPGMAKEIYLTKWATFKTLGWHAILLLGQ